MNYHDIKQLSAETGIGASELIALSASNDPFYAGLPSREVWARWFADIWDRFGWTTGLHLRRIHYVLVSQEEPVIKPDGTAYENTENDWKLLGRASLAARYLRMVPADGLIDRRNPEPIINAVNQTIAGAVPPSGYSPNIPSSIMSCPTISTSTTRCLRRRSVCWAPTRRRWRTGSPIWSSCGSRRRHRTTSLFRSPSASASTWFLEPAKPRKSWRARR